MTIKRWVLCALLCGAAAGVVAATTASSDVHPQSDVARVVPESAKRLMSGKELRARLSDNGRWLLVSEGGKDPGWTTGADGRVSESSGDSGGLYLSYTDKGSLRLVGWGGEAEGVSDDGRLIAYRCSVLTICIKRVASNTARRIALPCEAGSSVRTYMASDLRTVFVTCEWADVPVETKLVQIGPKSTRVNKIATALRPEALSVDGSVAILAPESDEGPTYIYRAGHVQRVPGVMNFESLSSNGRFIVGDGATMQQVACGEGCARNVPEPVVVDLDTGERHEVRLAGQFGKGSVTWVSNNGKVLVYSESRGITTYQALQLTNVQTASQVQLASSPNRFGEFGGSANGQTFYYVVYDSTLGESIPNTLYVMTIPIDFTP